MVAVRSAKQGVLRRSSGSGVGVNQRLRGVPGVGVPRIVLSDRTVAEDASVNDVIGVLSVANGSGSYTFTKTADPDSKFNINAANLRVDAALDYETATSHLVTIEADNGVDDPISRQFTITVTDVAEGGGGETASLYWFLPTWRSEAA